jgi:hypothetical protein
MCVTEIHYKKEKQTMEISHRIFADDLEEAIEKKFGKKCDLFQPQSAEIDGYVQKYIDETFQVSLDGKTLETKFIGKELDKDALMVYMEIDGIAKPKSIKISDRILFELLKDQTNLIHFHQGKNVISKKLNARASEATFPIN